MHLNLTRKLNPGRWNDKTYLVRMWLTGCAFYSLILCKCIIKPLSYFAYLHEVSICVTPPTLNQFTHKSGFLMKNVVLRPKGDHYKMYNSQGPRHIHLPESSCIFYCTLCVLVFNQATVTDIFPISQLKFSGIVTSFITDGKPWTDRTKTVVFAIENSDALTEGGIFMVN